MAKSWITNVECFEAHVDVEVLEVGNLGEEEFLKVVPYVIGAKGALSDSKGPEVGIVKNVISQQRARVFVVDEDFGKGELLHAREAEGILRVVEGHLKDLVEFKLMRSDTVHQGNFLQGVVAALFDLLLREGISRSV